MKVAVYQNVHSNKLSKFAFADDKRLHATCDQDVFIGYEELTLEKPKRTVTKDLEDFNITRGMGTIFGQGIPYYAKNIRILYDIEE
jgi:hypothetical protein